MDITIFFTALPCNTETHLFFFHERMLPWLSHVKTKCTCSSYLCFVRRLFILFIAANVVSAKINDSVAADPGDNEGDDEGLLRCNS